MGISSTVVASKGATEVFRISLSAPGRSLLSLGDLSVRFVAKKYAWEPDAEALCDLLEGDSLVVEKASEVSGEAAGLPDEPVSVLVTVDSSGWPSGELQWTLWAIRPDESFFPLEKGELICEPTA